MLPTPGFHHLHLNSVDPDAAIDWYARQFPSCSKGDWGGFPALLSPNNVMVLFTKVESAAADRAAERDLAFRLARHGRARQPGDVPGRADVDLLPLYTTDEGGSVLISSDTWPNIGGVLGLTKAQIAEARSKGVQPPGGGGFAYMTGPDNALVEYAGNYPAERFNHVHLWQEEPLCALLWYQRHLNAPVRSGFARPVADRSGLQGSARQRIARGRRSTGKACSARRARASSSATWCSPGTPTRASRGWRARADNCRIT